MECRNVFAATETALGRTVVIKVLPAEMAGQVSIDRFKREIALAARLQHPHIVPLLAAGDSDGLPYFTMPFVDGESLRRGSRTASCRSPTRVAHSARSRDALAYAHEQGVVHRDIKPDNVLLSGGAAMVTDFGVAKALDRRVETREAGNGDVARRRARHAGVHVAGAGERPIRRSITARTSMRSVRWRTRCFTGRPPFAGRSPQAMLAAHVTEVPEPIAKRRPTLPPALGALVMRCLEKRPADRPQSASEIVHALDDITTPSGGTAPLPPAPSVAEAAPRATSWKWIAVGAVAVARRDRRGDVPLAEPRRACWRRPSRCFRSRTRAAIRRWRISPTA